MKTVTDKSWLKDNSSNLVVKNLDKDAVDNDTLFETFSKFGKVVLCKVSKTMAKDDGNTVTSISNGYGFV